MAVVVATGAVAAVAGLAAGLEMPASGGFGDCFEHALIAINSPRIVKLASVASFCWRDQDDSIVPVIVLLLGAGFVDFLSVSLSLDFHIVVILSPPLRLGAVGKEKGRRRANQECADLARLSSNISGASVTGEHGVFGQIRAGSLRF